MENEFSNSFHQDVYNEKSEKKNNHQDSAENVNKGVNSPVALGNFGLLD